MNADLMAEYYARRADEYDRVYQKPERQSDLRELEHLVSRILAGHDVIEVACGTGYWTQFIARTAQSVHAEDINEEVLEIASRREYGSCRVSFLKGDAYVCPHAESLPTAGFHGFWWSHIPIGRIAEFLASFHDALPKGATVVMIDNSYVAGSSTPITRRDEDGNTYQIRRLRDGSTHEVLKNFPTVDQLRSALEPFAEDVRITELQYYWLAQYIIAGSKPMLRSQMAGAKARKNQQNVREDGSL